MHKGAFGRLLSAVGVASGERYLMRWLVLSLLAAATVATGALSACDGNIGDPAGGARTVTAQELICTDGTIHPGIEPIRRMTSFEYDNTLRDLLGDTSHPSAPFPQDEEAGGFDNNAANLTVSDDLAEKYMVAAEGVSQRATAHLSKLTGCTTYDDACATKFIDTFGKRAFRRPLTDDERADFVSIYQSGKSQSHAAVPTGMRDDPTADFTQGIQMVIEVAVQSPELMYRVEPVDPSLDPAKAVPLDSYEMASRLSYFLWGSMPDDALFAAADAGALTTKDQV